MTAPNRKDNCLYACLLSALLVLTLVIFAPGQPPHASDGSVATEPADPQGEA